MSVWFDIKNMKEDICQEWSESKREGKTRFPRFLKLETYVGKSKQYQKLSSFPDVIITNKGWTQKKDLCLILLGHFLLIQGSNINLEKTDQLNVCRALFRWSTNLIPLIVLKCPWVIETLLLDSHRRDPAAMGAAHPRREWLQHLPQLSLQGSPQQSFPCTLL